MYLGSFPSQLESRLQPGLHALVAGHGSPDADCLGSLAALGKYLRNRGCRTTLYCATPPPPTLRLLPGLVGFTATLPKRCDLVLVVDCGDLPHASLSPALLDQLGQPLLVNIDHHQTNTYFGEINLVLPEAASTTEILYHYLRQVGLPLEPELATALLVGILGDTGGFQHPNTTPQVLEATAELISAGASLPEATALVFQDKTVPALRGWGRVLSQLKVHPSLSAVVAVLSARDHADLPDPAAATSGLANFLNTLAGVRLVVVLAEQPEGAVKVSLRTRDPLLDVSKFAMLCGGGGHKLAAGFTIKGRLEESERGWQIVA